MTEKPIPEVAVGEWICVYGQYFRLEEYKLSLGKPAQINFKSSEELTLIPE